jgi:hypothetical protein
MSILCSRRANQFALKKPGGLRSHKNPSTVALFGLTPNRDSLRRACSNIVQSKSEPLRPCHNLNFYAPVQFCAPQNVKPVACPRLATLIAIGLYGVTHTTTAPNPSKNGIENSSLIQAGSFLLCHLSSTGFSNTPRRNSVLAAPMRCIRAALSEGCETIRDCSPHNVPKSNLKQARQELASEPDPAPKEAVLESAPESERWDPVPGHDTRIEQAETRTEQANMRTEQAEMRAVAQLNSRQGQS